MEGEQGQLILGRRIHDVHDHGLDDDHIHGTGDGTCDHTHIHGHSSHGGRWECDDDRALGDRVHGDRALGDKGHDEEQGGEVLDGKALGDGRALHDDLQDGGGLQEGDVVQSHGSLVHELPQKIQGQPWLVSREAELTNLPEKEEVTD